VKKEQAKSGMPGLLEDNIRLAAEFSIGPEFDGISHARGRSAEAGQ